MSKLHFAADLVWLWSAVTTNEASEVSHILLHPHRHEQALNQKHLKIRNSELQIPPGTTRDINSTMNEEKRKSLMAKKLHQDMQATNTSIVQGIGTGISNLDRSLDFRYPSPG